MIAAVSCLIWSFRLCVRLAHLVTELAEVNQQIANLQCDLRETIARLRVATDELGRSVGLTQKQMDERAQQIIARQSADAKRFEAAQKQTAQQVSAVQTDVSGVKTDLTKT